MKKEQKQSAVEFVELLKSAQKHVRQLLAGGKEESLLDMLQQCQQGAIQIGTMIEESEGEGFVTVKLLEDYCEQVFCLFEMVQSQQFDAVNAECDSLLYSMDSVLYNIEKSIHDDLPIRKEMVFLPYKASMWDSLESVWKAAKEDEEYDVYVIPIPYFDKNPDGSAREMHYEGDLFPDYVEITHYNDYDIRKRLPDIIFIHNPYDEANYVTSVHPAFYSKQLKEYTDCLVYIPYFVLGEVSPKDTQSIKKIEHFILVPGVVHADKVVVQSEDMRRIYIDVMTAWAGENTAKYWEEKIVGIGSPKFDKVSNRMAGEMVIPEEWKKIIEKPDGTRKKIIFYNTSVSALLENGEKMLDKMQDVFGVFKKNVDEIALLWRPHPLIKATIGSMRPALWQKYETMVQKYREEGWGIYDDSPDMDRAVALCDGYYGDQSSVVQLCRKVKKPVLVQDVRITEKSLVADC